MSKKSIKMANISILAIALIAASVGRVMEPESDYKKFTRELSQIYDRGTKEGRQDYKLAKAGWWNQQGVKVASASIKQSPQPSSEETRFGVPEKDLTGKAKKWHNQEEQAVKVVESTEAAKVGAQRNSPIGIYTFNSPYANKAKKENRCTAFRVFSNFARADFLAQDRHGNHQQFASSEQYIHYQKAILFKDFATADRIMNVYFDPDPNIPVDKDDPEKKTPAIALAGECKRLGNTVKNFNEAIWQGQVRAIALKANLAKFKQNWGLKRLLLATGKHKLVNSSEQKTIWTSWASAQQVISTGKFNGPNMLGEVLMEIREILKAEESKAQAERARLQPKSKSEEELNLQRKCNICLDFMSEFVVFVPCGHAETCTSCAPGDTLKHCPTCRAEIEDRIFIDLKDRTM